MRIRVVPARRREMPYHVTYLSIRTRLCLSVNESHHLRYFLLFSTYIYIPYHVAEKQYPRGSNAFALNKFKKKKNIKNKCRVLKHVQESRVVMRTEPKRHIGREYGVSFGLFLVRWRHGTSYTVIFVTYEYAILALEIKDGQELCD